MKIWQLNSGTCDGAYNMALDEALLEWVRQQPGIPMLIVRTYGWEAPTLSLGVNQSIKDLPTLLRLYDQTRALVRRPTGGRAILHGADISFSFVTNEPTLLKMSLKDSYCVMTTFVKDALTHCELNFQNSCEQSERAYTRSPVCFQTQTPSDLLGPEGEKLVGSAQLRRAGGILQHGAAFIAAHGIANGAFTQALFDAVGQHYALVPTDFPIGEIEASFETLLGRYRNESREMVDSVSMTAGSHLAPASP